MSNVQHVPCSLMKFSEEKQSGNLEKVKIVVMHSQDNLNNTFIGDDSVEEAKDTLKNIPILAFIKRDEDGEAIDFDQHNVITKLVMGEDGYEKTQYFLERPIGVIPETNNYRIEEIDGVNHVVVDGYIWKTYANEGYDLISKSGEKSVSMEINVEDGAKDKKTGLYHIKKYSYLGVTVLGDDVPPAMGETCKLTTYSSNEEYKLALEELNKEVEKLDKEAVTMSVVNQEPEVPVQDPTQTEPTTEPATEPEQEPVATEPVQTEPVSDNGEGGQQNFSLTVDNLAMSMRQTMSGMQTVKTNRWNETYNVQSYYLRTIMPTEGIAVVEDGVDDYSYYGVPYSLNGDDVILDFDNKKPYIQVWREKQTGEEFAVFSEKEDEENKVVDEKFSTMNTEITTLKETIATQTTELEGLRTFKLEKDKENLAEQVSTVVAKFSELEEDEYKEVKTKALNGEMDVKAFEFHLFALKGMKDKAKEEDEKQNFSQKGSKVTEPVRVAVTSQHTEPQGSPVYGSLFGELQEISKRGKK